MLCTVSMTSILFLMKTSISCLRQNTYIILLLLTYCVQWVKVLEWVMHIRSCMDCQLCPGCWGCIRHWHVSQISFLFCMCVTLGVAFVIRPYFLHLRQGGPLKSHNLWSGENIAAVAVLVHSSNSMVVLRLVYNNPNKELSPWWHSPVPHHQRTTTLNVSIDYLSTSVRLLIALLLMLVTIWV